MLGFPSLTFYGIFIYVPPGVSAKKLVRVMLEKIPPWQKQPSTMPLDLKQPRA